MANETETLFRDNPASAASFGLAMATIVGVELYLFAYAWMKLFLRVQTLENFLTARSSFSSLKIGFSMFASAVGSWVITAPSYLTFYGGALACFAYAFGTALPIVFTAQWGSRIRNMYPDILSFSDFAERKFGRVTQLFVVLLTLLNMSIFMIAEYTNIYKLYSNFIGLGDAAFLVVLLLSLSTLTYTLYGGVKTSIITDQVQGISALVLSVVVFITIAATFNKKTVVEALSSSDVDPTFVWNDASKGFTETGYSTLFTLPFSLICASVYSESWWQRAWAAADEKSLKKGGFIGALLVFFVVSIFGATGVLVLWAGIPIDESVDADLIVFRSFTFENRNGVISSPISVLTIILATIMAQSAIDSLQNAMGASVIGALAEFILPQRSLLFGRAVVFVLNIPLIIVALQQYNILSLFLLGNMFTICSTLPLVLAFDPLDFIQRNLTDWVVPLNFLLTIMIVGSFGEFYAGEGIPAFSFRESLEYAFWTNSLYHYQPFLIAITGTIISTSVILIFNELL